MKKKNQTAVWEQYLRGRDYLRYINLYEDIGDCFRFYEGDQWSAVRTYGEKYASLNVLKPIVDYKISTVAQNNLCIYYSSLNFGSAYEAMEGICGMLNIHAARLWEKLKMDRLLWDIVKDAAVCGDAFLYFYDEGGAVRAEILSAACVLLSDETQSDLQRQAYILIEQRMRVEEARALAKANGIADSDAAAITADDESDFSAAGLYEAYEKDRCTVVTKLYKDGGGVRIVKTTKDAPVMRDTLIAGLKNYPIAHYCWNRRRDSARGVGEILYRIPNQTEINKGLVRLLSGIRQYAYPHIVYDSAILSKDNVEKLSQVGSNIALSSNKLERVGDAIKYLQPAQISGMANEIVAGLISKTRELAGAGDITLGDINPELASGAAIIAVRDAAAQPLNMQIASLKDFTEDVARIWFDLWTAYNPNGLAVVISGENGTPSVQPIDAQALDALEADVKVDISPANPFSKYAQEQTLEKLFTSGTISFEEYVGALEDDAAAPKAKLARILEQRRAVTAAAQENKEEAAGAAAE
jgi:hypothetical protein